MYLWKKCHFCQRNYFANCNKTRRSREANVLIAMVITNNYWGNQTSKKIEWSQIFSRVLIPKSATVQNMSFSSTLVQTQRSNAYELQNHSYKLVTNKNDN